MTQLQKDLHSIALIFLLTCVSSFAAEIVPKAEEGPKRKNVYFQAATLADGAPFVVLLRNPERIKEARDILSGKETKRIRLAGTVVKAPAVYNNPWRFHVDPDSITFFENAVEVCDSTASLIQTHLEDVGGAFLPKSHWCPWSSRLLREVDAPEQPVVSIVSAASMAELAISPGSLASVLGDNMTRETESAAGPDLPTKLAGAEVELRRNGSSTRRKAPLLFASPQRINFLVPGDVSDGLYSVKVLLEAATDREAFAPIETLAPGLFFGEAEGERFAAATLLRVLPGGSTSVEPLLTVDSDGRYVPSPIRIGEAGEKLYLSLYGTGITDQEISVLIDGNESPILFSGQQSTFPGLDQINLEVPPEFASKEEAVIVVSGRSRDGAIMESVPVKILCPGAKASAE